MLSPEEKQIAEYGKAQGKSQSEILGAIAKYRTSQKPETVESPKPSFVDGVKSDFAARVDKASDAQISAIEGKQSTRSAALQTIGHGAGFITDLASRALGAVVPDAVKNAASKTLQTGVNLVPKSIADMGGDAIVKYNEWKSQHPEAAANLESIGNLIQLAPVGTIAAKGTQVGVKGALVGTGKALEATSDAISTTGRAVKGTGSVIYNTAITPNVKEAERILSYRANTPFLTRVGTALKGGESKAPLTRSQTALEKGIMGTESMVGVQARRASDSLWKNEIAPAVAKSDVQMSKDDLFSTARARVAATTDPTRQQALQNALDALEADYAKFPDTFDLTKGQALKRDLATFTPTKIFKGQEVASELRTLQADMADAIRQKTYEALKDENIKKKYLDWANLHELENVGVKAISEGSFKGGSGTLISGLWDMATTPIKTIGGQVLYRVGNKIEFTGAKGIKTLGQYLQQKGYAKPKEYSLPQSELGVGLSIKPSVTPEKVASKIDRIDRDIIAKYLDEPDMQELDNATRRLFVEIGIDKATPEIRVRFLREVMDISGL